MSKLPRLNLFLYPKPSKAHPRQDVNRAPSDHHDTAENLQIYILTPLPRLQRASNRTPRQRRQTDDREHSSRPHPNLADIRDLRDERGRERNEGAATKAVESREEDDGDVASGGNPKGEHQDRAEVCSYDHGVKAAHAVGDVAGDCAAEDGDCVGGFY